jgi:hypothetical protein
LQVYLAGLASGDAVSVDKTVLPVSARYITNTVSKLSKLVLLQGIVYVIKVL